MPGYELLQEVGRGGMGVVYKARQLSLNRIVALKMILSGSHAGPRERERFRREAEAVARLQHPNIVQIFEIGEANGHLYLALEFIEGGSLAGRLTDRNPWPPRAAAKLVGSLALAMHYAHSKGVVHRDLKPGNILLDTSAGGTSRAAKPHTRTAELQRSAVTVKITDFGLAKRLDESCRADGTRTGAVVGTPSYMAPEQASGHNREVGPAADIYSLGAILYELLTGRPPFLGETVFDTILQVLNDDPVPPKRLQPSVPRDLETICLKCLNKSPSKRYETARELADDLRHFLQGEPIRARPLSPWGRAVKWASRHPALTSLGFVTLLATAALVVTLSIAYARVHEAARLKEEEAAAARAARQKEAEARRDAERLAAENELARQNTERQNRQLQQIAEQTRRASFALQLAQIASVCEREPRRARDLLDDERRCPPDLRDFAWAYLHRLCERQERVYLEHVPDDGSLHAVACSPTGEFVATAGDAGPVRLWDPRNGQTWAVLLGNVHRVNSIAFSPDGMSVATAGADGTIRIWDLPTELRAAYQRSLRGPIRTLLRNPAPVEEPPPKLPFYIDSPVVIPDAHSSEVHCLSFSPDGRWLVSGGGDNMLRWWDLVGYHFPAPMMAVAGAAGVLAATRTAPATRGPLRMHREVQAHPHGGVLSLAFATAGNLLITGGGDKHARVWTADGSALLEFVSPDLESLETVKSPDGPIRSVAISPDGRYVAITDNRVSPKIHLRDRMSQGQQRLLSHTGSIVSVSFSSDGEWLVSASSDKSVRLWSVENGRERGLFLGHELGVSAVAFSPDRRRLVSVSSDRTARVWRTTPDYSGDFTRGMHFAPLSSAAISVSGDVFAISSMSNLKHLCVYYDDPKPVIPVNIDIDSFPLQLALPLGIKSGSRIKTVTVAADGKQVAFSSDDHVLYHVHFTGLKPGLDSFYKDKRAAPFSPTSTRLSALIYALAFSPEGRRLATLDLQGLRLWPLNESFGPGPQKLMLPRSPPDLLMPTDPLHGEYREVQFHPTRPWLVLATRNGLRILDIEGDVRVLCEVPSAHAATIEAITFGGENGNLLASGDHDGLIRIWRVEETGRLVLQAQMKGHTGSVNALAFTRNGRTLASGGFDRTIILWDPVTGQEQITLNGHIDTILSVRFTPDSSALLSIGREGIIKRWPATKRE